MSSFEIDLTLEIDESSTNNRSNRNNRRIKHISTKKKNKGKDELPSFTGPQSHSLLNALNNEKFADVTFIIGSEQREFRVNRVFLAAHSAVFEAMLFGQMRESRANSEIEITDIDPNAFGAVIRFCYVNDPQLSAKNIICIRQIADKYQMNELSALCDEYFSKCLSATNLCSLLTQSIGLNLSSYVQKCEECIKEKLGKCAEEMISSLGFVQMSLEAMKLFLQNDYVQIGEDSLWEAVIAWKDYQISKDKDKDSVFLKRRYRIKAKRGFGSFQTANKRKKLNNGKSQKMENKKDEKQREIGLKLLKSVCPFIRFGLMNAKYFIKEVKPIKCLSDKQVADVLTYHHCKDQGCGGFNTESRWKARRNSNVLPIYMPIQTPSPGYKPTFGLAGYDGISF